MLTTNQDYKERWATDGRPNAPDEDTTQRQFKFKEAGVDRFNDYYDHVEDDDRPY